MLKIATAGYYQKLTEEAVCNGSGRRTVKVARKVSVPLKGVLKQQPNGWVYVNVSNDVIHGLYSLIAEEGVEKPPYFNDGGVGAHISAIHESELKDKEFKDVGREVTFKLGPMVSVEPEGWKDMERVYFIEVDSPDLEKIRQKYGLPKTYKGLGHSWHITVGTRPRK